MSETVISALIGAGGAVIVCLITQFFILKKTRIEMAESAKKSKDAMIESQSTYITELKHQIEMISYQIGELSKRVDQHNQVIERTYALEKRADVTDEQIKVINHRIDDLERLGH